MIRRMLLIARMARPAVVVLLGLFAVTGLAQAGHDEDHLLLARVLVVVFGFLVFSVACNDLADVHVDRVNLPGDPGRPLVAGTAHRRHMVVVGATAAVLALAASLTLHQPAAVVTLAAWPSAPITRFARFDYRAATWPPPSAAACYVAEQTWRGIVRSAARCGRTTCCCSPGCTSVSSAGSCSRTSAMSAAMRCSANVRSWSGTAALDVLVQRLLLDFRDVHAGDGRPAPHGSPGRRQCRLPGGRPAALACPGGRAGRAARRAPRRRDRRRRPRDPPFRRRPSGAHERPVARPLVRGRDGRGFRLPAQPGHDDGAPRPGRHTGRAVADPIAHRRPVSSPRMDRPGSRVDVDMPR